MDSLKGSEKERGGGLPKLESILSKEEVDLPVIHLPLLTEILIE